MTTSTDPRNADQAANWNGPSGRRWVERQEEMDELLAPVSDALFAAISLSPGMRVLDIGCGSGDTSLKLGRLVAPGGHVLGLDISAPLLARARERTPPDIAADFVEGDATLHAFPPADADLLFSRFGVMFFAEPARAFANMRKGLKSAARLAFACWREPKLNPWLMLPLQSVRPLLPPTPPPDPLAPGPFAFADADRVKAILGEAGFADIGLAPVDLSLDTAHGAGLDAAVEHALEIGPASRALENQPQPVRAAAFEAMKTALRPFERSGSVPLGAAIWIVTGRA